MFSIKNYIDDYKNGDTKGVTQKYGGFSVVEYFLDTSVPAQLAETIYFCNRMNIRKRQLLCNLKNTSVIVQSDAMQWMVGQVSVCTGVSGAGDFTKKMIRGAISGESAIKPKYSGDGLLILEPTYRHIILCDIAEWGGSVSMDDGLFLASDARIQNKIMPRKTLSSAVFGNEGLFDLCLVGQEGIFAMESPVPRSELIEIYLRNDELKIDGNLAIAWSSSLNFTVERTTKTLAGSAASGEGLVNVYRGTGKVWLAPVEANPIATVVHTNS